MQIRPKVGLTNALFEFPPKSRTPRSHFSFSFFFTVLLVLWSPFTGSPHHTTLIKGGHIWTSSRGIITVFVSSVRLRLLFPLELSPIFPSQPSFPPFDRSRCGFSLSALCKPDHLALSSIVWLHLRRRLYISSLVEVLFSFLDNLSFPFISSLFFF